MPHHRRYRSRSSLEKLSGRLKYQPEIDFPLFEKLTRYSLNLIGFYPISEDFLHLILSILPLESRSNFIEFIKSYHKDKKSITDIYNGIEDTSDIATKVRADIRESKFTVSERCIEGFLFNLLKENLPEKVKITGNMRELKRLFGLSDWELEVISFSYCYSQSEELRGICDGHPASEILRTASVATGIRLPDLKRLLNPGSRLLQSGIVEKRPIGQYWNYNLEESIEDYLTGIKDSTLAERYCKKVKDVLYRIDSFPVDRYSIDIIRALLKSEEQCNILLYGEPGTGKTEFAKAITRYCRKDCYFFQHNDEKDERAVNAKVSLRIAVNTLKGRSAVLVIDEADWMINTDYVFFSNRVPLEKGWLNNFLDKTESKIIWISKDISNIDRSTLRRFSYSLHFNRFTKKQREDMWIRLIKKSGLKSHFTKTIIKEFSKYYDINAGDIASVLHTLEIVLKKGNEKPVFHYLDTLLKRQAEITNGKRLRRSIKNDDHYDIKALNVDVNIENILRSINRFEESKRGSIKRESGLNLLFWGKSGTGKTEFARYIAKTAQKELLIRRASDLLSPYVGETEKNIRRAFYEAEMDDAILLLDEADSFFTVREHAFRSWEVTRTNELLTQMESYWGILICCTNILNSLDQASLRRFQWKIEFRPLTNEGKIRVFKRYFSLPGKRLSAANKERLMQIEGLTFGDIKTVWERNRLVEEVKHRYDELIYALEDEVRYRKDNCRRNIGFKK